MKSKTRACTGESTSHKLKCDEREHQVQVVSVQHSNRDSKQREEGLFKDEGSCRKIRNSARRQVNHTHTTLTKYRFSLFSLVFLPWTKNVTTPPTMRLCSLSGGRIQSPSPSRQLQEQRYTWLQEDSSLWVNQPPTTSEKRLSSRPPFPPHWSARGSSLTLSLHVLPLLPGTACPSLSSPCLAPTHSLSPQQQLLQNVLPGPMPPSWIRISLLCSHRNTALIPIRVQKLLYYPRLGLEWKAVPKSTSP